MEVLDDTITGTAVSLEIQQWSNAVIRNLGGGPFSLCHWLHIPDRTLNHHSTSHRYVLYHQLVRVRYVER